MLNHVVNRLVQMIYGASGSLTLLDHPLISRESGAVLKNVYLPLATTKSLSQADKLPIAATEAKAQTLRLRTQHGVDCAQLSRYARCVAKSDG